MELNIRIATTYGASLEDLMDLTGVDPEELFEEGEEQSSSRQKKLK